MNKTQPLLDHISPSGLQTITLNAQEINIILGLQLPKTSLNYKAFWENPKNRTRVQSLLGLSSNYTCKVKLKERVVIFKKKHLKE